MKEWKKMIEEAEKRDHRKLGTEQKLFFLIYLTGSCFLPHGTRIYRSLVAYIREEYHKRNYKKL